MQRSKNCRKWNWSCRIISTSKTMEVTTWWMLENLAVICCRQNAKDTVLVSDDMKELIIGVRSFLQDFCEPPCYVSDRRLLKAVDMLKV
jgi:hypothetical protein